MSIEFEIGYIGLILICFLSATILPFPSEAFVLGMIVQGYEPASVLILASLANWLGSLTNYGLGRFFNIDKLERWLGLNSQKVDRWQIPIEKYGLWMGFLSWVPFIGDPLTLVLGIFRVHFLKLAIIILFVKSLRYAVLIYSAHFLI